MKKKEKMLEPLTMLLSVYFSILMPPLSLSSPFENMFSSFIMKLAVGREIVSQGYKSLLYSVSRLQNSEYYTQRETKYKNNFLSRFRPLTEKREKTEENISIRGMKIELH